MFKYSIPIPVPLGTTLYEFNTDCCNVCYLQEDLNDKINTLPENKIFACSHTAPCHTRFLRVDKFTFSYNNLEYVLKFWNTRVFTTYEEAEKAGKKLVSKHIKEMNKLGYKLNSEGKFNEDFFRENKKDITKLIGG